MKELTCKEVREFMKEHFTTYPTILADSLKKEIDRILAAFSASHSDNRYECSFITDKAHSTDLLLAFLIVVFFTSGFTSGKCLASVTKPT